MNPSYSQIILIACFWQLIALGVTFLRFGQLPGDSKQIAAAMLGFLLVGLLSGFVLIFLLRQTVSHRGSVFIIVGYILAAPFGYGFGIVGPLALNVWCSAATRRHRLLLAFPSGDKPLWIFAAHLRSGGRLTRWPHQRPQLLRAFISNLGSKDTPMRIFILAYRHFVVGSIAEFPVV